MSQKLILGIDIGTSSVRAALYDVRGRMLPESLVKKERALDATDDGGAEIDADVALGQVVQTVDSVLAASKSLDGEIAYVASCAFWHSLVGVDQKGKPTTKVFGWADTRSWEETAVLRNSFNETEVHDRTGARFHSSFWPAKLLWLKKKKTRAFEKTAKWLSLSDYFSMKLHASTGIERSLASMRSSKEEWQYGGIPATSVSMASATGLFDLRRCRWDDHLMSFVGIDETLLPRIEDDEGCRALNSEYRRRWPRLKNSWWFPSIGDGAASNIGSGCVEKSRAALMVGTSGAIRVAYQGKPPKHISSGLWCYRIDSKRVIIGGALSDGGGLYARLKGKYKVTEPDAEIGIEMARRGADTHGLTVMPFFSGERSTGYNEHAKGSIVGLQPSHDGIDILQAAMEAVAFRFAEVFDQLKHVARVKEVVATGGALSASPVWTQIIADVLGRDLELSQQPEASMRGAVLLALETIGKIENIQAVSTETIRTKFHPACHKIYKAARKRHKKLYSTLHPEE